MRLTHRPAKKKGIAREEYIKVKDMSAAKDFLMIKGIPRKAEKAKIIERANKRALRVNCLSNFSLGKIWGKR